MRYFRPISNVDRSSEEGGQGFLIFLIVPGRWLYWLVN